MKAQQPIARRPSCAPPKTRPAPWWLLVLLLAFAACSSRRPVLYPNAQTQRVGEDVAARDVDDCMRRADEFVASGGRSGEIARDTGTKTAVGAGTGAAIGAVGGAITGNAGEGAAVGAATGATAGFIAGMFGASEPDPVFVSFVDRCLRERGYEPIGWR